MVTTQVIVLDPEGQLQGQVIFVLTVKWGKCGGVLIQHMKLKCLLA